MILLAALPVGAAQAHEIRLEARLEGGVVVGRVTESDGTPVVGVPVDVSLERPTPEVSLHGMSAQDGRFHMPLTALPELRVKAEGEEAHIVETRLPLDGSGTDVGALVERIARLEKTLQWRDLLGVLGYLFGLSGFAAWVSTRRNKSTDKPEMLD
ncbi:MAG: hypothetical protein R3E45_04700 [Rhodocyclaceae bacterium]